MPCFLVEIDPRSRGAYCLHHQCTDIVLTMAAVSISETSVTLYQTTRRYDTEDSHLHTHCHEKLKFHRIFVCVFYNIYFKSQCIKWVSDWLTDQMFRTRSFITSLSKLDIGHDRMEVHVVTAYFSKIIVILLCHLPLVSTNMPSGRPPRIFPVHCHRLEFPIQTLTDDLHKSRRFSVIIPSVLQLIPVGLRIFLSASFTNMSIKVKISWILGKNIFSTDEN
jgi:hypothetical protein